MLFHLGILIINNCYFCGFPVDKSSMNRQENYPHVHRMCITLVILDRLWERNFMKKLRAIMLHVD